MKNGLLLDFLTKKLFHKISNYFFYTFTVFFGDKFILEHFFSNLSIFLTVCASKIKQVGKNSFINFFKATLYITMYGALIGLILYML